MMLNLKIIFSSTVPCIDSNERCTLLNSFSKFDQQLLDSTDTFLTETLLFGNSSFTTIDNSSFATSNQLNH